MMWHRTQSLAVALLVAVAMAGTAWVVTVAAQAPVQPVARASAAAARPDLNGIWQALTTANWDIQDHSAQPGPPQFGALFAQPPGQGIVEGNELPYLPAALAKKKQNFEKRFSDDPEVKCFMPGVPRATYMPYPFQIHHTQEHILIAYQFAGAVRTIHLGPREPNPEDFALDTWMGYSRGRWEGRTLVVEAAHFNDKTWFDRAGNYHSDALKVTERYTPVTADVINYEATIEDPKVFSRPWKMGTQLYRLKDPNAQLLSFKCPEFAEELMYGQFYRKKPS
jgi:hypothetical protein